MLRIKIPFRGIDSKWYILLYFFLPSFSLHFHIFSTLGHSSLTHASESCHTLHFSMHGNHFHWKSFPSILFKLQHFFPIDFRIQKFSSLHGYKKDETPWEVTRKSFDALIFTWFSKNCIFRFSWPRCLIRKSTHLGMSSIIGITDHQLVSENGNVLKEEGERKFIFLSTSFWRRKKTDLKERCLKNYTIFFNSF